MSTHYLQWRKATDGLWYCWAVGTAPPGDLPVCGTSGLTLTADVFDNAVTLDDMHPACREYHLR